jgi:hypothetical protein
MPKDYGIKNSSPSFYRFYLFRFLFALQYSRKKKGFLFSLFLLQNSFFIIRIKFSKYGLQTSFKADVLIMGNSAQKKKQPFPVTSGRMGNFSKRGYNGLSPRKETRSRKVSKQSAFG